MFIFSSLRAAGLPLLLILTGAAFLLNPDWAQDSAMGVRIAALALIAGSLIGGVIAWRSAREPRNRRLAWAALTGGFGLLLVLRLNDAPALSLFLLAVALLVVGFMQLIVNAQAAQAARAARALRHPRA